MPATLDLPRASALLTTLLGPARAAVLGLCAVLGIGAVPGVVVAAPATLVNAASSRCLAVTTRNGRPTTAVQLADCAGAASQLWETTAATELRTLGGSRCLDATRRGASPGAAVLAAACNGQASQRWRVNAGGSITSELAGLCLMPAGGGTAAGTSVQVAACQGSTAQQWAFGSGGTPDTQAPTPPSGLALSGLTCRSATLTWAAASDNVGVAFYDVYHDGQQMATVGGGTLSAALTLTPGANWGLYVNARDAAGNVSQASATLPVQVPQCSVDTEPPTTPANLQGTVAGTTASLSWSASSDNVGVTGYDVYRNDAKVGTTTALSYADSGLTPNTAYRYAVAARDAQNNVSGKSVSLSLTTGSACANVVCSVDQVATESDLPWGLAPLADGTVLYSRRDAQSVVLFNPATGVKTTIGTVPNVQGTDGEGGLMGLAVTAGFPATDPWLYVHHTSPSDNRIVRLQYKNGALDASTLQVLLSGIGRNKFHNGGRLRFGPDGKLYASTGDAQNGAFAQDLNNLAGKVLRLNPDGSRPADNPFGNYVWSYGHRNPQGLAFDSQGRLWEQEFGNSTMDETNLIQKGGNYGWPNCEGTSSQGGSGCATAGYIAPKATYPTSEGSCSGLAVVRDAVYIACQRGTRVYRHVISGSALGNTQQLFVGTYGRLRTIEPTIDGGLWMATSQAGDKDSTANNSAEKIYKVNLGN